MTEHEFIAIVNANHERARWAEELALRDAEAKRKIETDKKRARRAAYCKCYSRLCYAVIGAMLASAAMYVAADLGFGTAVSACAAAAAWYTAREYEQEERRCSHG